MYRKFSAVLVAVIFAICFFSGVQGTGDDATKKSPQNSTHVYWLIKTSIKDGEMENLKAINVELVNATRANEPGTLTYDWSISADGKSCYFCEHYVDSEAVMMHLKTFGEKYAERLLATVEIQSFKVFGAPNENVTKALSGFGAEFHKSIGGFTR